MPRDLGNLTCGFLILSHLATPVLDAQGTEKASTQEREAHLRQELRKLRVWGITKLLQTQRDVDELQRKRANYSASASELSSLAADEDPEVRFYVATNRQTPLAAKVRLARDWEAYVRCGVASTLFLDPQQSGVTKSTVEDIGVGLSEDSVPLVRLCLARNPELPARIYELLASDSDSFVRKKVAENIHINQTTLAMLVRDTVEVVRRRALRHRNVKLEWLEASSSDASAAVRLAVCRNINTPPAIVDELAQDNEVQVRRAAAAHRNVDLTTLAVLMGDPDSEVRVAVAAHPKTNRDMLTRLAYAAPEAKVRLVAKKRLAPFLRGEIRDDLLERPRTD